MYWPFERFAPNSTRALSLVKWLQSKLLLVLKNAIMNNFLTFDVYSINMDSNVLSVDSEDNELTQ